MDGSKDAQKPFPQPPEFGVVLLKVVESPTRINEIYRASKLPKAMPLTVR